MPVSEHVGEFIEGGPSEEQLRPTRPAVTEEQRDEMFDCSTLRQFILAQAQQLVDTVTNMPADGTAPNAHTMVTAFTDAVEPIVCKFRIRKHQHAIAALVARRSEGR